MEPTYAYIGKELDLFSHASNWKAYFSKKIHPFLSAPVLEVGAGTGNNSFVLNQRNIGPWHLLEPDAQLLQTLQQRPELQNARAEYRIQHGDIQQALSLGPFRSILYIDVLEHIQHDQQELQKAINLLAPGGHIIILAPAFSFLFSPFDKSIGHYRRYSRRGLRELFPAEGGSFQFSRYLDSMGFFASLVNRYLLKQDYPRLKQIQFWDRVLIPVSRILDPLFGRFFGKSVLMIWQAGKK